MAPWTRVATATPTWVGPDTPPTSQREHVGGASRPAPRPCYTVLAELGVLIPGGRRGRGNSKHSRSGSFRQRPRRHCVSTSGALCVRPPTPTSPSYASFTIATATPAARPTKPHSLHVCLSSAARMSARSACMSVRTASTSARVAMSRSYPSIPLPIPRRATMCQSEPGVVTSRRRALGRHVAPGTRFRQRPRRRSVSTSGALRVRPRGRAILCWRSWGC